MPSVRNSLVLLTLAASSAGAQLSEFARAMEFEQSGRAREAAQAYRSALATHPAAAMLGLERAVAEIGWRDTLLLVVDSAIRARPRETTFRVVQLRTLRSSGRAEQADRAFERWVVASPSRDPVPYREYARLLLQTGQIEAADTVLKRAQRELGGSREFLIEIAQIRSSMGLWGSAAEAWREALVAAPFFEQAASFTLQRADSGDRSAIRAVLSAPPVTLAARRLLATLELQWGSAANGWTALRTLPRDSATFTAWRDFVERAERADAWIPARDALVAMLDWRASAAIAVRAAVAALEGGQPASALLLAGRAVAMQDSVQAARHTLPVVVEALAALGRAPEAHRVASAYAKFLDAGGRARVLRHVAWAWVRAGDIVRARATLDSAGGDDAADEVQAWLALYEGNLRDARDAFRTLRLRSPESIRVMSLLSRTRADSAPSVGRAILALARGDTAAAAAAFSAAADSLGDAAPVLLAMGARLSSSTGDEVAAVRVWSRIVERYAASPEAPEAALDWARLLRRRGQYGESIAKLEQLILSYPGSALLPQARRELELARSAIRSSN